MPELLAQTPPPDGLSEWLQIALWLFAAAGSILGCFYALKKLREPAVRATMVTPQPLDVRRAVEFVNTDQFDALTADVEELKREVKDGFEKLGKERQTSTANLHSKVDETNTKVDRLVGEVALMNQQQSQIIAHLLRVKG